MTVKASRFKKLTQELDANSFQLIDLRTPSEFNQAHIQGALNIDIYNPNFRQELAKLDTSKKQLIYCLTGGRSQAALNEFLKMGFEDVVELGGGFVEWLRENSV